MHREDVPAAIRSKKRCFSSNGWSPQPYMGFNPFANFLMSSDKYVAAFPYGMPRLSTTAICFHCGACICCGGAGSFFTFCLVLFLGGLGSADNTIVSFWSSSASLPPDSDSLLHKHAQLMSAEIDKGMLQSTSEKTRSTFSKTSHLMS